MIDQERLQKIVAKYKQEFDPWIWQKKHNSIKCGGEQYKWVAVQTFQDNWDLEAEDFADMLEKSLKDTGNLLNPGSAYPRGMILGLAKSAPEDVRTMFRNLFDENQDWIERIAQFKDAAQRLCAVHYPGDSHYQDENEATTYLWLRYPEAYYIFKTNIIKKTAEILDPSSPEKIIKGHYSDNLRIYHQLCTEINAFLMNDVDMVSMVRKLTASTPGTYADTNLHTLTYDLCFHISRFYSGDSTVQAFYESEYEMNVVNKASRKANKKLPGKDFAVSQASITERRYWVYAPGTGATYWEEFYHAGIMAIGWDELGDLSAYATKEAHRAAMEQNYGEGSYTNDAHATWQFANDINAGDIVFVKKGNQTVLGRGIIQSDYVYDDEREYFKNVRKVEWTHKGEWSWDLKPFPIKTLTDMTDYKEYVNGLNSLFDTQAPTPPATNSYSKADFLCEVYVDEKTYDEMVVVLDSKKNIILQGAPGVGKTFAAKRLAYSMMGEKNAARVEFIQFHQNYSYEDFMMGFKPTADGGFVLQHGIFYDFCKKAEADADRKYFFIIDEINRGNMSKIFGELLMAIEADHRGEPVRLAYSNEAFSVPQNLYIIGMMNTADRSLAMIDYALRRRFSFFTMEPAFMSKQFSLYQEGLGSRDFNILIKAVVALNATIAGDASLGKGFCIGHSYFCGWEACSLQKLQTVVKYDIIPMLEEYWFDDGEKCRNESQKLQRVVRITASESSNYEEPTHDQ